MYFIFMYLTSNNSAATYSKTFHNIFSNASCSQIFSSASLSPISSSCCCSQTFLSASLSHISSSCYHSQTSLILSYSLSNTSKNIHLQKVHITAAWFPVLHRGNKLSLRFTQSIILRKFLALCCEARLFCLIDIAKDFSTTSNTRMKYNDF